MQALLSASRKPRNRSGASGLRLLGRMSDKIEFGTGLNVLGTAGFHCTVRISVKLAALERAIGGVVLLLRRRLMHVRRKSRAGEGHDGSRGQCQLHVRGFHSNLRFTIAPWQLM